MYTNNLFQHYSSIFTHLNDFKDCSDTNILTEQSYVYTLLNGYKNSKWFNSSLTHRWDTYITTTLRTGVSEVTFIRLQTAT